MHTCTGMCVHGKSGQHIIADEASVMPTPTTALAKIRELRRHRAIIELHPTSETAILCSDLESLISNEARAHQAEIERLREDVKGWRRVLENMTNERDAWHSQYDMATRNRNELLAVADEKIEKLTQRNNKLRDLTDECIELHERIKTLAGERDEARNATQRVLREALETIERWLGFDKIFPAKDRNPARAILNSDLTRFRERVEAAAQPLAATDLSPMQRFGAQPLPPFVTHFDNAGVNARDRVIALWRSIEASPESLIDALIAAVKESQ